MSEPLMLVLFLSAWVALGGFYAAMWWDRRKR